MAADESKTELPPSPQAGGPFAMTQNPVLALSCLLGALLLTFLASCDSTPDKGAESEEWVAFGDRVRVSDALHSETIQADVYVDIDGTVDLPEIGLVQVAGHTATEIRDLLMKKYAPYHDGLDIRVEIRTGGEKFYSANLGRVVLIRADPREPRTLIIDRSESIDMGPSTLEPEPTPAPEPVPDESWRPIWWACGGRSR